jgi:hypothetical protein
VTIRLILVCDGAAYFDDGAPDYGTFKCTKTLPAKAYHAYMDRGDLIELARARGWRIGPKGDVMCPDCSKPDPRTLRLIEALGATQRGAS